MFNEIIEDNIESTGGLVKKFVLNTAKIENRTIISKNQQLESSTELISISMEKNIMMAALATTNTKFQNIFVDNTLESVIINTDDLNVLTVNSDTLNCNILNITNVLYGFDANFTFVRSERLDLTDGTNDIIFRSPSSTGRTTVKYGAHTNIVTQTLPNIDGIFAISGGLQSVIFGSVNTSSIVCNTIQLNTSITNSLGAVVFDPNAPGISSLNGSTVAVQTFATVGTTGTAPNWSTNTGTGVHTLNIPIINGNTITAGLISNTTQTIYGQKTFANDVYVDTLRSVDYIYGQNNAYLEFIDPTAGSPPSVRAVSAYDWQIGGSHSANLNKQVSIGYSNTHDGALLYGYDQGGGGGAKPFYIGYPGIPSSTYFSGLAFQNGNRPIISGPSSGTTNITFGANISSLGAILAGSGGISISKTGTGVYRITFDCGAAYGIVATIAQSGQAGFITSEIISATVADIIIRDSSLVATDWNFNISALGYKAI